MMQEILVLDVGIGNVGSICNMFKYIGIETYCGSSSDDVLSAKKIVLPGVGAFDAGMNALHTAGVVESLRSIAEQSEVSILGICLGMHLLFNSSEEGKEEGLGLIPGRIKRFNPTDATIKVPHMGWNKVSVERQSRLIDKNQSELRYYFVHSYYAVCSDRTHATGITHHGIDFTSVAERDNVTGVQFHPEKSHRFGMHLLKKFSEI